MPDRRDIVVHLAARKLAALPGFGPLHDLDLQLVGCGEIRDRHPEASAGHLLDRGAAQAPVRVGDVAGRVLSAFARIGLGADAVHGQRERLVGLPGDGAEAHGAGGEALHDLGFGLDLVERHGGARRIEFEQTAQGGLAGVLVVGVTGEAPVGVLGIGPGRDAQSAHGSRVPHVARPALAPVEVPGIGQRASVAARLAREAQFMAPLDLFGQHAETDPAHAALRVGEAAVDHLRSQPDRLEDLRPLVGLQGRDAHLGHHLEDALADALAVGGDHVVVGADVVEVVHAPGAPDVPQRLEGEIGVDGVRPVADEQAVVVHFACLPGFHDQGDARTLVGANQMVVNAAEGEQGTDGKTVGADRAVGEHEHADSFLHGPAGFPLDARKGVDQAPFPGAAREGGLQGPTTPAAVLQA